MKKTSLILASLLVCSAGYAQQFGDFNNDSKINVTDVTNLAQKLMDDGTLNFDRDINGDGNFNVSDVTRLAQYILDDELPARPVACVDLGLSVKWAAFNLGATSEEAPGNFYAWGEIAPKSEYTESNSLTYSQNMSTLMAQNVIDADGVLTAEYDAATANCGEDYRMPTKAEIQELITRCTWVDSDEYFPIIGVRITGPNGQSIFLPQSGQMMENELIEESLQGYFWSSTCDEMGDAFGDFRGYALGFTAGSKMVGSDSRHFGRPIRLVKD